MRRMIYTALAALMLAATSGPAFAIPSSPIETWGANVTKFSVTYYTYDVSNNLVANRLSLAKPKAAQTPNVLLVTLTDDLASVPQENTRSYISINGRFFVEGMGTLPPSGTSMVGYNGINGVLVLDDTLTFSPAADTPFKGSGRAIMFYGAMDLSVSGSSKNGVDSISGRLGVYPKSAKIVTVTDGNPDEDNAETTKMVMKPFSYRGTKLASIPQGIAYTDYAGAFDFVYTLTASSVSGDPDIGVPQAGSLSLDVDSGGNASFNLANGCIDTTSYQGYMNGLTAGLYSGNDEGDSSCMASGEVVFTFSDTDHASGSVFIIDTATGRWTDGTIELTRAAP